MTPGIGPAPSVTVPVTVICAFTEAENTIIRIKNPKFLKYLDLLLVIKKLVINNWFNELIVGLVSFYLATIVLLSIFNISSE
ncbi:hypothetical protein GCM10022422_17610 [Flavobacterium ginsengisoli]|uniref:Uncharacterized protein n=1 Tax=Flavobacterium ginsengisoli TaxID=871694 RepID=A0ABP7FBP1_9FLAO